MNAIGKVLGWLGRKAVLYVVLVAAIAASTFVVPWVKQTVTGGREAQQRHETLSDAKKTILAERDAAQASFRAGARNLSGQTVAQLTSHRLGLSGERVKLRQQVAAAKPIWMLAITDKQALLRLERDKLQISVIDQELAVIDAALSLRERDASSLSALADLRTQQRRLDAAIRRCSVVIGQVRANERAFRWRVGGRWIESAEHKRLVQAETRCRAGVESLRRRRDGARTLVGTAAQMRRAASTAYDRAAGATIIAGRELAAQVEEARVRFSGTFREKARVWSEAWQISRLLRTAAIALALIIATPFLIRLVCFFVLAPLAIRRAAIRLRVPDRRGVAIAPAASSATSVAVRLDPGEELLVRQDYLQTSSHAGAKRTKWLLTWRKPFTSIATGLTFLTRIRGDGEVTTVSAVRDGLAEVTILTLPEGASCVLQPRALAAVAQPIRRRLRITRHWRLGSLNAWLTLQLRYLVFHGPARLVLKGGRGVRVERAEQGRVFGQDQLVGFSADLAYSVTRTETFWPYFFGREQLLKDRVMVGEGVLIIEEAPLTARRGEVRRGIEGMIDAGMKVFGI